VGHGGAVFCLAFEYDSKVMIPLLMACFDQLNPTSLACATTNVPNSQFEKGVICLVLEHPWKNHLVLLLLENFIYLGGYISMHLHM
jgi:hypothetical protein